MKITKTPKVTFKKVTSKQGSRLQELKHINYNNLLAGASPVLMLLF